ncbi:hypothetical protein Dimus_006452 [Dionaea muscipula]
MAIDVILANTNHLERTCCLLHGELLRKRNSNDASMEQSQPLKPLMFDASVHHVADIPSQFIWPDDGSTNGEQRILHVPPNNIGV